MREVGLFDERFFTYVEDLDLSMRVTRAGHTIMYEPSARLFHRIGRAAPATANQIRLRDKNRRRVAARHLGPLKRLRFALWFYPTRAMHLVRYAAQRDWVRLRAILEGALGSLA
jgi:GT2 family glycosyltransferase